MGLTLWSPPLQDLAGRVIASPKNGRRQLVAVAGAPASGKSTLAQDLVQTLSNEGHCAKTVPMDGFHLSNQILMERGRLDRKGAPDTFDALGFLNLVARLQQEDEVFIPIFDRARDIALMAGDVVGSETDIVVVEGNYLLFDAPIWRDLSKFWDVSIWLDVRPEVLKERLVARWLTYGHSAEEALARASHNDLKNAEQILQHRKSADIRVVSG